MSQVGREMYERAADSRSAASLSAQQELFMARLLGDASLRVRMLRFVDVLPTLTDDGDVVDHLHAYLGDDLPKLPIPVIGRFSRQLASGLKHLHEGVGAKLVAGATRAAVGQLGTRFIAGSDVDSVVRNLQRMHKRGIGFTLDVLGEATVSEAEAEALQARYLDLIRDLTPVANDWPRDGALATLSGRAAPTMNLSVKVSSLFSQIDPVDEAGSAHAIKNRLRPIMLAAREAGAFITLDMESYDTKAITLRVFKELLVERELADWPDVGIAIQAYLRDADDDIDAMIAWAKERGTPVKVRLVRGAYWDYETATAKQHDWDIPVWTHKTHTDACYERCLDKLFAAYPLIETAVATHNLRSQAVAYALAEHYDMTADQFEYQMLYGMADAMKDVIVAMHRRLRVYVPFGELLPGMAYLVRRLLENTSSQSFVRMSVGDDTPIERLLAEPIAPTQAIVDLAPPDTPAPYRPEPLRRFVSHEERADLSHAIEQVRTELGATYDLTIGEATIETADELVSINPARHTQVVGRCPSATHSEAALAVTAAREVLPAWSRMAVADRAKVLRKAAQLMRDQREKLTAWEVFEAAKPWREADGDVAEAISFLAYYADQAVHALAGVRYDVPGEENRYHYLPRGVAAVIAPWNFPLAIPTGMVAAALVTGNTVVLKPAPQTPIIARLLCDILKQAGLPDGVLTWLPGGDEPGRALVAHPDVNLIVFTGSEVAGRAIIKQAADVPAEPPHDQAHIKHVIAEMGGKNAIIVDSDADVDDAVSGVIASAFGYTGQKCSAASRVIVVGELHDAFVARLTEAAASLQVGLPELPGTSVPPVIDSDAYDRIRAVIGDARERYDMVFQLTPHVPSEGFFIGPTIVTGVMPDDDLAQREVFGPVLAVLQARDFDEAIAFANRTRYALTGGVYSRDPRHLEQARRDFQVGNLYLNRTITGAIVGRQPFGGFKYSGIGSKAGGPDYLLQFVQPRTVTENTIRQGFAPEA